MKADLYKRITSTRKTGATIYFHSKAADRASFELGLEPEAAGEVEVEVVENNVVVTVRRIDEASFGPVSLVVV